MKLSFSTTNQVLDSNAMAVRSVEMACPLSDLNDVENYWSVRVFVTHAGVLMGYLDITNQHQSISREQLKVEITRKFERYYPRQAALHQAQASLKLPYHIAVSIVVATCDRPTDLRRCLQHLVSQKTVRPVEIVVVDNRPKSGLTAPVVAEFPAVVLLSERRVGSSCARNAGIIHSRGDIVVTIDDDATAPADWLETLLAPFVRAEVMAVTGNILPLELETQAQQLFETYGDGGLSRGFQSFEVNQTWLERSPIAIPTWELGTTANAAFRAELFRQPQVGLLAESLGAGVPVGGGEDLYFFYKILKAGHTMVYQSSAYVWHRHRRQLADLRRQVYNYSKGLFAYYLMAIWHHGERSPLKAMLLSLPLYQIKKFFYGLTGQSVYPASLVLIELAGYFAAPWSLWRSRRQVQRHGRSLAYISETRPTPVLSSVN